MKILFILFLLSFSAVAFAGTRFESQATKTAPAAPVASPEAVVKEFYRWYITRLQQNRHPLTQEKTALGKYLTPEFLRKAPGLIKSTDADPFICAQDWDEAWSQNITISKLSVKGTLATMTVFLKGKEGFNQTLKVSTKLLNGGWRLDSVAPITQ